MVAARLSGFGVIVTREAANFFVGEGKNESVEDDEEGSLADASKSEVLDLSTGGARLNKDDAKEFNRAERVGDKNGTSLHAGNC